MTQTTFRILAALLTAAAMTVAQAQGALRPEIGKPLKAAESLIKSGKYREALIKVKEADAVRGKTTAENSVVERMRLAAASGAGEADVAAKAFDDIGSSMGNAEKLRVIESIAGTYYRDKQYSKAQQWYARYFKEGGTSAVNRNLMIQTQYLSGDYAGVIKDLTAEIQSTEKAGAKPSEDRINLLMNAAVQSKNVTAESFALERLVTFYPKKEYWVTLMARMQRKPGFSDQLTLDTYRLSLATGSMTNAGDYSEMAQLALQAGLGAEAKAVVDKGFASGALGTGPQADRHKRLRDLITKRNAESAKSAPAELNDAMASNSGDAMVSIGLNDVYAGQKAQGLKLMEQGIAKGNLRRPEETKLHLAIAELVAGDNAKAQSMLKTVSGTDGTADLARLWGLYARRAKTS